MDTKNTEQTPHARTLSTSHKVWKKYIRLFFYTFATLIVLCFISLSAVAFFLYKDPVAVSKKISQEIQMRTGIELQFSSLDMTFIPAPALVFNNVTIRREGLNLAIPELAIRPSFYHLFHGEIVIKHLRLFNPHIRALVNKAVQEEKEGESAISQNVAWDKASLSAESLRALLHEHTLLFPQIFRNGRIEVFDATVELVYGADALPVTMSEVHMRLALWDDMVPSDSVMMGIGMNNARQSVQRMSMAVALSLQELHMGEDASSALKETRVNTHMTFYEKNLTNASSAPSERSNTFFLHTAALEVETRINISDVLQEGAIECTIEMTPFAENSSPLVQASWKTEGDILWKEAPIAFAVDGDAYTKTLQNITFENVQIALEDDRLTLNGLLKNVTRAPSLQGVLDIGRVSLTQWFGFARNLPPGLRYTLDDISGSLSFTLDGNSLDVPFIDARAADAQFQGRGGVASWSDVVIFLDVSTPHVALVKAFAEAEGETAPEVTFHHEPLTPVPGTPEAQNMSGPDINYDINIGADAVDVWSLRVGQARFRCLPSADVNKGDNITDKTLSKLPKGTPENSVLLNFHVGNIYGGRADGDLWLYHILTKEGVYEDTGYTIHANVQTVRLEDILSRFRDREGLQPVGGSFSADTQITARGQDLSAFFLTQKGRVSARLEKGFFSDEKKKLLHFDTLSLDASLVAEDGVKKPVETHNPHRIPEILRYNGQWRIALKSSEMQANAHLKGAINFSDDTYTSIRFNKLRGEIGAAVSANTSPIGRHISPEIRGAFSLDTRKGVFEVHSADTLFPELANTVVTGSATVDFAKDMRISADIESRIKSISSFLQDVFQEQTETYLVDSPQNVRIKTQLNITNKELRLDALSGAWGEELEFQGKIRKIFAEKPLWDFTLQGTMLDWENMFPSKADSAESPTGTQKPWSWTWLNDVNAQGSVALQMFRISKIAFTDLRVPIRVENGVVDCKGSVFALYGGNGSIDFVGMTKDDALHIQGGLSLTHMQLPLMSASQQLSTLIGGTGNAWFSVQGPLRRSDDVINALEGTWRIQLEDGYLQERNEDGSLKKAVTKFQSVEDAGTLSKGILHSNNFRVTGPDLNVHGNGHVNFIKKTMDVRWNVSASGFTNIPVRFHGSIDAPQREVGTGTVILQAIFGIFTIFGSFISGFFNLFQ